MPSGATRRGNAVAALPLGRGLHAPAKPAPQPAGRSSWPLVAMFAIVCCSSALFTSELLLGALLSPAAEGPEMGMPPAQLTSVDLAPRFGLEAIPSADKPQRGECFSFRDYGLVDELRASAKAFCSPPAPTASAFQTSYAFLRSDPGGIQATVFSDLRLDLSRAQVAHDIRDLSQDGGGHDPRFKFDSVRALCACENGAPRQDMAHGAPRVWNSMLAGEPSTSSPKLTFRAAPRLPSDVAAKYLVCDSSGVDTASTPDLVFQDDVHVVLMARKDDHNPFFQVSAALNAWLMLRVLNWSADSTQLVYLDRGLASPVDELQQKLVAPRRPALTSDSLFQEQAPSKTVHFGSVLLSPFESSGPMMRHLDDKEPCSHSQLVQDFRGAALAAMGVDGARVSADKPAACLVTVISRRDYGGRKVQRVWRNEDEVLARMRSDFGGRCSFQSMDFVNMTMAQQMRVMVDSDAVIGMHGAGLVNVLWTRPGTLVLEIFPKQKRRWGYRNICQHVGCDWHEFRGGKDVLPPADPAMAKAGRRQRPSSDPNAFDKTVTPDDWAKFANPLVDKLLVRLASPSSTPMRLRVGATNSSRHYPLGWLLTLLAGAGTLAMVMSLLTVEDGLWQSATQLITTSDKAAAFTPDPARAQWIAVMRAINNQNATAAPIKIDNSPTVSSAASESRAAFMLPPDVREPPKFATEGDAVVSDEFQCFSKRDYGVIARLANSTRQFCAEPVTSDSSEEMVTSSYTHLSVGDADLMATAFRHLRLDLRNAQVAHDISAVSEDGGGHDPRIRYTPNLTECSCAQPQDRAHGVPRVWRFFLAADPEDNYVACSSRPITAAQWVSGRDSEENPLVIAGRNTVVLSRKDDHNPFFQLSALFNTWIAVQAASWSADSTQLLFLDKGLPTPMDELQHALLAPSVPAIRGEDVLGRVVHLESALIAPIETSGPLMTHLNDPQPCQHNQLLTEFRRAAIRSMGIDEATNSTNNTEQCVVTVISRRAYGGRRIQRMWTNENEVLDQMRADYGDRCVVQSFDFADLPMQEQMRLMLASDVVIGMHGAGMVNVAWTRPGTLVVEIFPKRRFRWGYRNLCQFLGCDWHEFRKGRDVMVGRDPDPNAMDKTIDYGVWKAFFDPLLRSRLANTTSKAS